MADDLPTSLEDVVRDLHERVAWNDDDGCYLEEPHAHVLADGDYSAYTILGVFDDLDLALAVRAELARVRTGDDPRVECRPWISADETAPIARIPSPQQSLVLVASCYWTGDGFHETESIDRWQPDPDLEPLPDDAKQYKRRSREWTVWDRDDVAVRRTAYETSYTLGSSVHVGGVDHDRVRKVYSEQRALLIADPAAAAILAWTERALEPQDIGALSERGKQTGLPYWVWLRDENRPLLDAFRRAGVEEPTR